MAYVRGNKMDFDNWKNLGNDGWGYEDVLPYFVKSEKNIGQRSGIDGNYLDKWKYGGEWTFV